VSRGLDHGPDPSNERAAFAARTLTVADLDAIAEVTARRVAEIVSLPASTTFALVSARELARELGVSQDYVYSHADELGGMRLGSGRRARIRLTSTVHAVLSRRLAITAGRAALDSPQRRSAH